MARRAPRTADDWRAARQQLDAANEAAIAAERDRQVWYLAERDRINAELDRAEQREALAAACARLTAEAEAAESSAQQAAAAAQEADQAAAESDAEAAAIRARVAGLRERATARRADADAATTAGDDNAAIACRGEARALDEQADVIGLGIQTKVDAARAKRAEAAAARERVADLLYAAEQKRWQHLVDPVARAGSARLPHPLLRTQQEAERYRRDHRITDTCEHSP